MASMVNRYADDLLSYALDINQLEDFYTNALILVQRTEIADLSSVPEKMSTFLQLVPPAELRAVMSRFIVIAVGHFSLLDVSVYSAVPLSEEQRKSIEGRLVKRFNKQISMSVKVDPSLLGGLRIIAGHTVIDNSIKRKLSDLKKNVYKGVYFK